MIRKLGKEEAIPYELLLMADESMEAIQKYIFDSDIYVIEEDKVLLGVYVLQQISNESIEIKNIAVLPGHRGKGIGKKLLHDAEKRARNQGYSQLIIGTGDMPSMQLSLYKKFGFEVFDRKKNFFLENYTEPMWENGIQLKDMLMLRKQIAKQQQV